MKKFRLAQLAVIVNFFGSVLLLYAFVATSSDFTLVTDADGNTAICVGDKAFMVAKKRAFALGTACPEGVRSERVAGVYSECPECGKWGMRLLILGFFMQFFTMEKPATQIYRQQKRAQAQGKS